MDKTRIGKTTGRLYLKSAILFPDTTIKEEHPSNKSIGAQFLSHRGV